jgi:YD repeat-containing protein
MTMARTLIGLIILFAALLSAQSADAQQVCYSYDGLGRLVGLIDQNNQAAFYDYDVVGNILSIRRQSPGGPVNVLSIEPSSGLPGDRVEVFGLGFSAVANQNQVAIGSVPANVVSVLPCTLVVEVPANVVSGQISVTTPLGSAVSNQNFTVFSVTMPSTSTAILIGNTLQFTAVISGCADPSLVWSVNGIVGGNATVGTISSTGLYTAPASILASFAVTIRAQSVGCSGLFAEATITIVNELLGFVFANASANYGTIPIVYAPNTVLQSASANYGAPSEVLPPNVVNFSASIANVPVISSMSPISSARGSNFNITITGVNLAGATDLRFLGSAIVDAAITATNVTVNPTGTSLTANVSILSTAVTGTRTVIVQSPSGNSTSGTTGVDVFNVTP